MSLSRTRAVCPRVVSLIAGLAWSVFSASAALPGERAEGEFGTGPGGRAARVLQMRVGDIDTTTRPDVLRQVGAFAAGARYVIQLDGPLTRDREAALHAAGVALGQYLPQHAYLVTLDGVKTADVAKLGFVAWVGVFDPAWKLDPEINRRAYQTAARQQLSAAGMAELTVIAFDGADTRPIVNEVTRLGGLVRGVNQQMGAEWVLDVTMKAGDAPALAALPEVQFVEDGPEAVFRNDSNRWIVQSNVNAQTPIWDKGIHGEGQMGGLIDGTPRESHCMFDDSVAVGPTHRKFVAMRGASGTDTHGTHTAGTMAGDAAPFNTYTTNDGMAFAAKISFTDLGQISTSGSSLSTNFLAAHTDGARAHSNSWGDDGTRAYTNWCRQIDLFTAANEDSLVAFAVSNGSQATTPENSMNVLGVGASQDTPNQASFCSGGSGPTLDGRRKPEVYAPGCNTTSANAGTTCGTTQLTGTSMACPAVTGAGLLVRQYFTEGWYPTGVKTPANARTPSGALVKAVLINSAVDMTGISGYPSNTEGWGRVLLDNSLFFNGDARELYVEDVRNADGLQTGDVRTYTVKVLTDNQPLDITLVSTHPAAAVNASNPVVNNIDLEVTDPFGSFYRGNVFASSQSSTGGTADAKNNVERVRRASPTIGTWTITVRGTAVNSPGVKQGFALAASGDLELCTAPNVTSDPTGQTVHVGDPVTLSVAASGTGPLGYQWQKNTSDIGGATGSSYFIASAALSDAGSYAAVVSNSCGTDTSAPATLVVVCPADFNGDGFVNGDDFDAYVAAFVTGDAAADFNHDGFVSGDDFDAYNAAFTAGC